VPTGGGSGAPVVSARVAPATVAEQREDRHHRNRKQRKREDGYREPAQPGPQPRDPAAHSLAHRGFGHARCVRDVRVLAFLEQAPSERLPLVIRQLFQQFHEAHLAAEPLELGDVVARQLDALHPKPQARPVLGAAAPAPVVQLVRGDAAEPGGLRPTRPDCDRPYSSAPSSRSTRRMIASDDA
jgi:hypothetical protein